MQVAGARRQAAGATNQPLLFPTLASILGPRPPTSNLPPSPTTPSQLHHPALAPRTIGSPPRRQPVPLQPASRARAGHFTQSILRHLSPRSHTSLFPSITPSFSGPLRLSIYFPSPSPPLELSSLDLFETSGSPTMPDYRHMRTGSLNIPSGQRNPGMPPPRFEGPRSPPSTSTPVSPRPPLTPHPARTR